MRCEQCGSEFTGTGQETHCPHCGNPLLAGAARSVEQVPWERRQSWLDLSAMFETVKLVLIEPAKIFRVMPTSAGLGSPLLFWVLLGTVTTLVGLVWQFLFQSFGFLADMAEAREQAFFTVWIMIVIAIFSPILVTVGSFITAGILHLCLMIVGGAKNGFEATYRVVAYAGGATSLFQIVPLCGGMVAGVWNVVAMVIGLREIHETSTGRALAAVLLPLLLCCVCVVILLATVGAGIFAALMQMAK